jgi:hypothetical protein
MLLPDKLSDADIVRTLREHQLDYPGASYLTKLRAGLRPPTPFRPLMASDVPSYRFLQRHRVHHLFFRNTYTFEALEMLTTPRSKELIESLILAEEPLMSICLRLRRFGVHVNPKSVEYYEHFFFNTSLVDHTELRALISIRVEDMAAGSNPDAETLVRYKAMQRALYNDPRYVAVNAVSPQIAAMRLQMRHGLMPNRIERMKLAQSVQQMAMTALSDTLQRGGPEYTTQARDLASVAKDLSTIIREAGGENTQLNESLQRIALSNDTTEVQNIRQLPGGQYEDSVTITSVEVMNDKR